MPQKISLIKTKEEFQQFVDLFYKTHKKPKAFGICCADISRINPNDVISVNFPHLNFETNFGSFAVFASAAGYDSNNKANELIVDIDEKFLCHALCLYYPFIIEAFQNFENFIDANMSAEESKLARASLDQKIRSLTHLCSAFIEGSQPIATLFGSYAIAVRHALEADDVLNRFLASHKNIQVLLHTIDNYAMQKALDEMQYNTNNKKFQFSAFFDDQKTQSLQVAYMKLHALSAGYAPLRSLNLDSIFALLPNLAWSGNTPYELQYLRANEIALKMQGKFPCIDFIDKFPRYLMQVLPQADNIRILDSANTRFGAYLGAGYTQMPGASYVNFNSGALGACMNEGRISSSVIVGEGTDIGGGASILGVLSGGNTMPISIGKNCLLGANSVTGISLGNSCIVDAGISILAGSIIKINEDEVKKIQEINPHFPYQQSGFYKGHQLSGLHGLHFRITSQDSCLIAFRSAREITLNQDLH